MATYLKFHQLERSPFEGDGSDQLVLATDSLRRAYAEIKSGLDDGSPRLCMSGGPGIGKSSLARALPKLLASGAKCSLIRDPSVDWSRTKAAIAKQFGVKDGRLSRSTLMASRTDGRRLVIVIDEAEHLDGESLEHLDVLLGYRDDGGEQLVQCILMANLEAAPRGQDVPLLWWLDRLTTRQLTFSPIPEDGIRNYIDKHLKKAGARDSSIFDEDAIVAIHRFTGGVPGAVSALCEQLLAKAAELERRSITANLVAQMCGDELALEEPAFEAPEARTSPRAAEPAHELPRFAEPSRSRGDSPSVTEPEPELEIQQGLLPLDETNYADPADFFADSRQAREPRQPQALPRQVARHSPGSGRSARMLRNLMVLAVVAVLAVVLHAWMTGDATSAPPKPPTQAQMTPPPAAPEAIHPIVPPADRELVAPSLALEDAQGRNQAGAPDGLTSDLKLDPSIDDAAALTASKGGGAQAVKPAATDEPPALSLSELYEIAEKAKAGPQDLEPWSQQAPEATAAPAAPAPQRPPQR